MAGNKSKSGVKGMTRFKKFLLGVGVGTAVSTAASVTKVREIEFVGPMVDAAVGGGVEGQLGVAIPKLIRAVLLRTGFGNGNGIGSAISTEGA